MDDHALHTQAFFHMLRASLKGEKVSLETDIDISKIWQELKSHAIQHLAVDTIASIDPANQMLYIQSAAMNCSHWYALMAVQQDIMHILEQAHIPCAVIKGAAADIYYAKPLNRNMGDIDILVKPQDFERARDLLVENDCSIHDLRNPRHAEFRKNGIQIELHRHFATLSDVTRAETFDQILFDALDRAEKASIEGYEFYMLPKFENGLVLMEHINSHMETGLGLRQIIDWMLFADEVLSDEAWFDEFAAMVDRVGLEKLTVTTTRMCQLYLGLRTDITWCKLADEDLCHQLMEHTMQQGNFGRKQERRTRSAAIVLGALVSQQNFFQLLQKHGCHNWTALKRWPWLKPFAWLYQLLRYCRKGLHGKHPLRAFLQAFRKKKDKGNLLAALGVQRKNHALQYDS